MHSLYYSYEIFKEDAQKLLDMCRTFEADTFLSIARGGLTLSHFLAQAMEQRNLLVLNSISYDKNIQNEEQKIFNIPDLSKSTKVLLIDDMVDSGKTMKKILELLKETYPKVEFKLATLFYKDKALIKPDFYVRKADSWIDFFWEVDIK